MMWRTPRNQSSDAGLLLLREAEPKLEVCRWLAEAMPDRRDLDRVRHAIFEMVMAPSSAIACAIRCPSKDQRVKFNEAWYQKAVKEKPRSARGKS
jgi:hypothetical protein